VSSWPSALVERVGPHSMSEHAGSPRRR
jgi:hypothetical protein